LILEEFVVFWDFPSEKSIVERLATIECALLFAYGLQRPFGVRGEIFSIMNRNTSETSTTTVYPSNRIFSEALSSSGSPLALVLSEATS
jgi:hypothetical protein